MARLIYVMGPSGAGKDSVLALARKQMDERLPKVTFSHRYITRPAHAGGENHIALSQSEFALRLEHGCFAMHWDSHGNSYGIGIEIDIWMRAGLAVVVSGSRGYFANALKDHPDLLPVLVTAAPEVLHERLARRGRESLPEIEERLAKAAAYPITHPALCTIDNSGSVEDAALALTEVLLHV